jgi:hypothetical protein
MILFIQIEATMVPKNVHLVETSNPLKRIKARSTSYKAISIEEVYRPAISDAALRKNIQQQGMPTNT